MEENSISESTEFVLIPREEYNSLTRAKMGIDLIGSTLSSYGGDDRVVVAVCKQFGYEHKEDEE